MRMLHMMDTIRKRGISTCNIATDGKDRTTEMCSTLQTAYLVIHPLSEPRSVLLILRRSAFSCSVSVFLFESGQSQVFPWYGLPRSFIADKTSPNLLSLMTNFPSRRQ